MNFRFSTIKSKIISFIKKLFNDNFMKYLIINIIINFNERICNFIFDWLVIVSLACPSLVKT